MKRLTVILNPRADRGRAGRLGEQLRDALRNGFDVRIERTSQRGDGVELAAAAARNGCDVVVAVGGDGTVHEAVNGLMQTPDDSRPALTLIPAGSGNDVAFALKIDADLERAAARLAAGRVQRVDVGRVVTDDGRSRVMINNLGLLLEGQINLRSHELSWPRGWALYLRAALETLVRRPKVHRLTLTCDDAAATCDAVLLSVANGPRSGGRFHLLPAASLCDGRFNYLLATPASRLRLLWQLRRVLRGRSPSDPCVTLGEFAALRVRSDAPIAGHVDGEPWLRPEENVRELAVTVEPAALRVIVD